MGLGEQQIVGVLLAGGEGKRLWPLSTRLHPKQFLSANGDRSPLSTTIARNDSLVDRFVVVANRRHRYLVEHSFKPASTKPFSVIFESQGRDTAPAVAFAALLANPDDILLTVPTDHVIEGAEQYRQCVSQAIDLARQGFVVLLGITPTLPHTGYGYIRHTGAVVEQFVEKPSWELARQYVSSGDYLWNSGIFVFRARTMLEELERHCPDLLAACRAALNIPLCMRSTRCVHVDPELTLQIRPQSIDRAVIEKSDRLRVVLASFGWDDLGSVESVARRLPAQPGGCHADPHNVVLSDCRDVSVVNDGANSLVVVNGLEDTVVAATNNVVYVSRKGRSQDIESIIDAHDAVIDAFVEENLWQDEFWGYSETLFNTPYYRVRRLTVEPHEEANLGASERSVTLTAVVGAGTLILGDALTPLVTPHSLEISPGTPVQLENTTDECLRVMEVTVAGPSLRTERPIAR